MSERTFPPEIEDLINTVASASVQDNVREVFDRKLVQLQEAALLLAKGAAERANNVEKSHTNRTLDALVAQRYMVIAHGLGAINIALDALESASLAFTWDKVPTFMLNDEGLPRTWKDEA